MAKVERVDIVTLTLTSYELNLVVEALAHAANEAIYSSMQKDSDALKLRRELTDG